MLRENIKWKNHKIESTNVVNRDRLNRSSEDGVRIDIWTHFMRECIINYVH